MTRTEKIISAALIALKFFGPLLLVSSAFELHRDEYLYYAQGSHLAPGYLENPPMIGILAKLSALAGGSEFSIRIWPALFGAATLWLLLKLVKGFGGGAYALLLAGAGFLLTAYLRIDFLFQPNFLDAFFWTAACYCLQLLILTSRPRDLYLLSMVLALGWWAKYSVLFFIAALLIAIVLTPLRRWLRSRHFYGAFGLGLLLVLPNLAWQYYHNWPLLHHMSELRETQLTHLSRLTFLREQLFMMLPAVFLCIGGLVWLFRRPQWRAFGWLYLGIIGLLMLGSGKGYYAIGIYPLLLAAGGTWLESAWPRAVFLRFVPLLVMLLLGLPAIPLLLPLQKPETMAETNRRYGLEKLGMLRWEDGRNHTLQQDFADMTGWREMAEKTWRYFDAMPSTLQDSTLIYAGNYGFAGSLRYYIKDSVFKSRIISANGTFLLWIPGRLPYRHLLVVDEKEPQFGLLRQFAGKETVDSCTAPLSRQYGSKVLLYSYADSTAFPRLTEVLDSLKGRFRR